MTCNRTIEEIIGRPQSAKQGPGRPPGRPVADHRQKLVLEQARLTKVRADKLAGELVPAADVTAEWSRIVSEARSALLAVPSRAGERLGLSTEAVGIIDREVRDALEALASGAERPVDEPQPTPEPESGASGASGATTPRSKRNRGTRK